MLLPKFCHTPNRTFRMGTGHAKRARPQQSLDLKRGLKKVVMCTFIHVFSRFSHFTDIIEQLKFGFNQCQVY